MERFLVDHIETNICEFFSVRSTEVGWQNLSVPQKKPRFLSLTLDRGTSRVFASNNFAQFIAIEVEGRKYQAWKISGILINPNTEEIYNVIIEYIPRLQSGAIQYT